MNIDGFSLQALVKELKATLTGGRIDRINQPNKQSIIMSIRQPGENLLLTLSVNPQCPGLYLVDNAPENPPEAPTFCMVLRKHLEGGRISDVRQYDIDRIIILEMDMLSAGGKIITKALVAELMGKYSNLILTENDIIIDALRKVGTNSSRVRTVLPSQQYVFPPTQNKLNVNAESADTIARAIASYPDKTLYQAVLNTCLGFGPITAKELIFTAGLPYDIPVSELEESDILSLKNAISETVAYLKNSPLSSLTSNENGKIISLSAFPIHYLDTQDEFINYTFPSMSKLLEKANMLSGSYTPPDKERFIKLISNEISKLKNKLIILREDLSEALKAEEYKIKADNLMTYQYSFKAGGASEISVADIYSDEQSTIVISLNPSLSLIENCQNYYKKYNKLKRAQSLLQEQIDECHATTEYLESIDEALKRSSSLSDIADIKNELVLAGYIVEKQKKKPSVKSSAPIEFTSPNGFTVLVGKNNIQNDRLTFKIAAPKDIWFHAKDMPGSHAILRTDNAIPDEADILFAAQAAAAFSKGATSKKVPVDYTQCRYVKKPKSAKPGFVIFTNQRTVYVEPLSLTT